MHKIWFAAQQNQRLTLDFLDRRGNPFKLLIYLSLLKPVYLLSKPVASLIFKAWRYDR